MWGYKSCRGGTKLRPKEQKPEARRAKSGAGHLGEGGSVGLHLRCAASAEPQLHQPDSYEIFTAVGGQQLNTTALCRYIAAVIYAIPYSLGEKEQRKKKV